MSKFFKSSSSRRVLCENCQRVEEDALSVELSPDLFPGTFAMLECDACGARPGDDDIQTDVADTVPSRTIADNGQKSRILLVEDQFLLAACVKVDLEAKGFEVIGPLDSAAAALHVLRNEPPDAAVLDVNLRGELAWTVADALQTAGIPFVFATGYNVDPRNLRAWPAGRLVRKPYGADDIEKHLLNRVAAN